MISIPGVPGNIGSASQVPIVQPVGLVYHRYHMSCSPCSGLKSIKPRHRKSTLNQHNYGKSPFSMGKSTINSHFQQQTVSLPEGNETQGL